MSVPLATWVAASFALRTAGGLLWEATGAGAHSGDSLSAPDRMARGLLHWLVRIAFYTGVPYAALLAGIATPAQFALGLPDPAQATALLAPAALTLTGGALACAWLARMADRRYPPAVRPAVRRRAQVTQPWGVSFLLLETLCLQAHWTFYRAGAAVALPALSVWGGLALVATEWVLDPAWRSDMRAAGLWEDRVLVLALAIFSTHLASLGVGFWLSLCAHAVLWGAWLALLHALNRRAPESLAA